MSGAHDWRMKSVKNWSGHEGKTKVGAGDQRETLQ